MVTNLVLLNSITGVVIPILVALVSKAAAPDWLKAIITLALSAIAGTINPLIAIGQTDIEWRLAAITALQIFVTSVATYFGLFQPTGIDAKIQTARPDGFGPVDPVKMQEMALEQAARDKATAVDPNPPPVVPPNPTGDEGGQW